MLSKSGRKNLFLLLLCAEGAYELRQDGHNGLIGPGGVALMDTRLPGFCGAAQGTAGSFLTIPVDIWEQFAPPPSAHGKFIPSLAHTTVRLARGLALELATGGGDVGAEHKATLARQMVEILAIAATEASDHLPGSMHRQMVLRRIKSYIRNKISDSDLSPLTISQNFSISKRYISKLFQEEQMTVMDYIMTQRISMAKELLLQAKTSKSSIKDIAYRVGFRTPSHFSSTFSALLDMTPSDYAKGRTNSAGR
jgi:AraC-like DNA-binding protein